MALKLGGIYKQACRSFGKATVDENFAEDFITSVNASLGEMSFAADMSTAISPISSSDSEVSGLDPEHAYILLAGVIYNLMLAGNGMSARNGPVMMRMSTDRWDEAKGDWMIAKSREDQSSTDSYGNIDNDIIGLGYIDE